MDPTLSVICVYNDSAMRAQCLDRSLGGDPRIEYLPIDNTEQRFTTAGAALNHGTTRARGDVVAFIQQDIYLHSVDRLLAAAGNLTEGRWGLLGANGISSAGESIGRLRDRVQLIGSPTAVAREVESLDEILLLARRSQVLAEPISEHPDLAWHAYGVEYGLRMRRLGLQVGALDCAITHNSLSTNVARLDQAHGKVAGDYPEFAPLRTTCGIAGREPSVLRDHPLVARHRWRRRWAYESWRLARAAPEEQWTNVLADIRTDIDLFAPALTDGLLVLNHDPGGRFAAHQPDPLLLNRSFPVEFRCSADLEQIVAWWAGGGERSTLVTGFAAGQATRFRKAPGPVIAGAHEDGLWLLRGPAARMLPRTWIAPRHRPLPVPQVLARRA